MTIMRPNKNLKLLVIFSFFLIGYTAKAQDQKEVNGQTYAITDNGSVKDTQAYIDAINNSNMQNHRLKNTSYTIVFMTGLKVELFSAKAVKKNGISINPDNYPESFDSSRQEPVFALGANNFIIEYHIAANKQK